MTVGRGSITRKVAIAAIWLAGIGATIASRLAVWWVMVIAWGAASWLGKMLNPDALKYKTVHQTALSLWNDHASRWRRDAGNKAFNDKLDELKRLKREIENLHVLRQQRYQKLQQDRHQHQLEHFLERFSIEQAKLQNIGPGRKATLAS